MSRSIILSNSVGKTLYKLSKSQAIEMIKRGTAIIIGKYAIQRVDTPKGWCSIRISSGAEKSYELAAADKHPRFFIGGLTRNEHRPAKIPRFQGARVGHQ